ncbi:MAG TPA: hypothetical protein VGA52_14615 [Anaerolineales bacterium]
MRSPSRRAHLFVLACAIAVQLAACSGSSTSPTAEPQTADPPTITPAPTVTTAPDLVVLISRAEPSSRLSQTAAELAASSGLRFEVRAEFPEALGPEVRVLLVDSDFDGSALAASHPDVALVQLGGQADGPANLVNLRQADGSALQASFVAGYVGALITPNYRVGAVFVEASPLASELAAAFTHGVQYYCGLCRAAYPPFAAYPLTVTTSEAPSPEQIGAVLETLENAGVRTVYLAPPLANSDLALRLAEQGIMLVASDLTAEAATSATAAVIQPTPETVLRSIWEPLLAGETEAHYVIPLAISQGNENLLSDSRLRLVEQVLADVQAGFISP